MQRAPQVPRTFPLACNVHPRVHAPSRLHATCTPGATHLPACMQPPRPPPPAPHPHLYTRSCGLEDSGPIRAAHAT
eukprot:260924-Chlamydomonas_euryale.AAC.2